MIDLPFGYVLNAKELTIRISYMIATLGYACGLAVLGYGLVTQTF